MFYLIVSLIIILLLICVCVWLKVDNIKTNEAYYKLKISQQKQEAAWAKHCKALREQYQTAIFAERNKRRHLEGKCVSDEKCLYQGRYEIDPCNYQVKEKYRNVTVEISECKKCGYVDIAWYRQDDTEEVEVE